MVTDLLQPQAQVTDGASLVSSADRSWPTGVDKHSPPRRDLSGLSLDQFRSMKQPHVPEFSHGPDSHCVSGELMHRLQAAHRVRSLALQPVRRHSGLSASPATQRRSSSFMLPTKAAASAFHAAVHQLHAERVASALARRSEQAAANLSSTFQHAASSATLEMPNGPIPKVSSRMYGQRVQSYKPQGEGMIFRYSHR